MHGHSKSRREFIKKTAYIAPVVLTLNATAAFAGTGSNCDNGYGDGSDCTPKGLIDNPNAAHVNQDD